MPKVNYAVVECSSTYRINKWKKKLCLEHQGGHFSWKIGKLLEPPGIEFAPGKPLLEIAKLLKIPGKPLEKSYTTVCP